VDSNPEKTGVGGSIPSLATTFSTTYRPSKTQFQSISFQDFWPLRFAFAGPVDPRHPRRQRQPLPPQFACRIIDALSPLLTRPRQLKLCGCDPCL
jgi:hypothetical protein